MSDNDKPANPSLPPDNNIPLNGAENQQNPQSPDNKQSSNPNDSENHHDNHVEGYDAKNIKILRGIQAVRQTPSMYIADTSSFGLHHLCYEIVNNSIDEAICGHCDQITVKIHPDNSITVIDNGRGIPVDEHPTEKKSALEVITTSLHSGGKFDRNSYKVSGGLHGVGIAVVNALSEQMQIEVCRDGWAHLQSYHCGKPNGPVEKIGKTTTRGTKIWFKPDPTIFDTTVYSYGIISNRLRELSFLTPGVRISFTDERENKTETFYSTDGLQGFVQHLNQNKTAIHPDIICLKKEVNDAISGRVLVEFAFQYNDSYSEIVYAYANNIHTREGGTHISGLRSGLTRTLNLYAKKENLIKDKIVPSGEDWREGLTLVLSIKLPHPQFEGQTKARLGNHEVDGMIETAVNELLSVYLEEHPQTAHAIVAKGLNAAHVREATRKVRDLERQRKTPLHSAGLPGKLSDCSNHNLEETELYLVEGDSAGGSAKSGRDRRFQAILPLKGKIINVEKTRMDHVLQHAELKVIVTALGTGIQNEFSLERRRYGKIIIMTDADVDGSHIRTLLLTFFFRNMLPLIEAGYVYIAQPPLYRFRRKKREQYIYSDQEFANALLTFGCEGAKLKILSNQTILEGKKLLQFVQELANLERQLSILEKYQITVSEFLQTRDPQSGFFPQFRYKYKDQQGYFRDDEALHSFIKQQEMLGYELVIQEYPLYSLFGQLNTLSNNHHSSVTPKNGNINKLSSSQANKPSNSTNHTQLTDHTNQQDNSSNTIQPSTTTKQDIAVQALHTTEIEKSITILESYGVDCRKYFATDTVQFELIEEQKNLQITNLSQIITNIKQLGREGLDVQRYKGLGEMNPEQLWTTTMNPQTRTLFQVRLEDASEADHLFSVLMGLDVGPRRIYIEKHAMDVRNLDV